VEREKEIKVFQQKDKFNFDQIERRRKHIVAILILDEKKMPFRKLRKEKNSTLGN